MQSEAPCPKHLNLSLVLCLTLKTCIRNCVNKSMMYMLRSLFRRHAPLCSREDGHSKGQTLDSAALKYFYYLFSYCWSQYFECDL